MKLYLVSVKYQRKGNHFETYINKGIFYFKLHEIRFLSFDFYYYNTFNLYLILVVIHLDLCKTYFKALFAAQDQT